MSDIEKGRLIARHLNTEDWMLRLAEDEDRDALAAYLQALERVAVTAREEVRNIRVQVSWMLAEGLIGVEPACVQIDESLNLINQALKPLEGEVMAKGTPKRDGSGKGVGANKGRGGCAKPRGTRKGSSRRK